MTDDVRNPGNTDATWARLIYLILYGVIYWFANFVLYAIAIVQFIKTVLSGSPFEHLQAFGSSFAEYNRQIVAYMSYHSDEKPFPVGPWPASTAPQNSSAASADDVIIVPPTRQDDNTAGNKDAPAPQKKPDNGDASTGGSTAG